MAVRRARWPAVGGSSAAAPSGTLALVRLRRIATTLFVVAVTLLVFASAALAVTPENGGGQGWYGETDDKTITNAMFIVIAFFPTVITVFSIIQWRLDKRKHAKMDAAKRRAVSTEWHGGW